MLRLGLVVFGWPALLLVLVIAYGWVKSEFLDTIPETPNTDPIQHPNYHHIGVRAAEQYTALDYKQQAAVRANLDANLHTLAQWVDLLDETHHELVCIGEDHRDSTREFLARAVFDRLQVDVFLLEATERRGHRWHQPAHGGRQGLRAHVGRRHRGGRTRRAAAQPLGGAHWPGSRRRVTQRRRRQEYGGDTRLRDDSIARNLWLHFVPGQRNVILFGALHCTERPNWLYATVRDTAPVSLGKMRNVRVVGEHQDGPLEAFVFFLDEIGLREGGFRGPGCGPAPPARLCMVSAAQPADLHPIQECGRVSLSPPERVLGRR